METIKGQISERAGPGESVSVDGREISLGDQRGIRTADAAIEVLTASPQRNEDGDEAAQRIAFSFSSEAPVERWFGQEVLGHDKGEVDLDWLNSGRAPKLLDHRSSQQIGVIESASLDGKGRRGRAVARFGKSQLAQEVYQDIVDGIRSNVSVGYRIKAIRLESEDEDTGERVYRVTKWAPMETSVVALPADTSVGIGREDPGTVETLAIEGTGNGTMAEKHDTGQRSDQVPAAPQSAGPDREAQARELEAARQAAQDQEVARMNEIHAIGKRYGFADEAREAIQAGTSVEKFRETVSDLQLERLEQQRAPSDLDLSDRDLAQYSLLRAIRAAATEDWSEAGFERECSLEVQKRTGRIARGKTRGFMVPWDKLTRQSIDVKRAAALRAIFGTFEQRALATSPDTAGGHLVPTIHMAADFIELLRNRMVTGRMGIRTLPNLTGNVDIPKLTGAATFQMLAEGGTVTPSDQTFGNVQLTPKTGAAATQMTRRLMLQSDPAVDDLVMDDLAQVMAIGMDDQILNGDGTGNNVEGIRSTGGVATVIMGDPDGGAIDWPKVVEFETLVATANADVGNLGYVFNAQTRGTMKTTEKAANTAQFLWMDLGGTGPGEGMVNGYRALVSQQLPADLSKGTSVGILSSAVYGNWSDVIHGMWGTLDVLVDPYTLADSGGLSIWNYADFDAALRHPESFAISDDILNT